MLQKFAAQIDLRKVAALALVVGITACGGGTTTTETPTEGGEETAAAGGEAAGEKIFDGNVALTGAGASFPAPIYQNWFVELNKKVPELQVNYQSVGSGAGVEQFTAETVNFGASDVAMEDEEIAAIEKGVLLLPMTAGAIVMAYNLPGVDSGLNLTRDAYVDILLGNITNWNDPAIADANPDATLPDLPITVVHRSDGSGTTGVFTKHLSAISEDWASAIGEGKSVEWPTTGTFVGGKGNEGVTAQIQQTEGAIGYVEYGYATNNGLAVAALENSSGNFIEPSGESASATLDAVELPENLRAFITDPEGAESYPVVTYTWMMVYETYDDPELAKAVEVMVEYGLNEGQEAAPQLGYIALPKSVRDRVAEIADGLSPDYEITVQ
ncbi:MAG: phosphate ABC transporter substrate-binding protein PstS [Leptolyngbya sp. SIO1E4]|nr:phosphate ABC transporter substrate-binding protein PstS [Leptolyngbya sp. SIO1E4]